MAFWEHLPEQCPPEEAVEQQIDLAFRVVFSNPVKLEHFKSHAALGRPKPPKVDNCRYSSCSLFTSKEAAKSIARLPRMRAKHPFVAHVTLPQGAGVWVAQRDHIDFWLYAEFDPLTSVSLVEPV